MHQFGRLKQLGFNKAAIHCYQKLVEAGPAEVSDLAKELRLHPTNLYRTLQWLTDEGFIDKIKLATAPALFIARPLDKALAERYMRHRYLLMPLFDELGIKPAALPKHLRS